MSSALASLWDTPVSKHIAGDITKMSGVFCGPAAVVWIAAVWNNLQGRTYDYKARLQDKKLFADGPRPFRIDLPGFQKNLSSLLLRETGHELTLSPEVYFKFDSIHAVLQRSNMPVIVRMPALRLIHGLHYVTVYRSDIMDNDKMIQFHWQDNGLYGSNSAGAGLSKSEWRRTQLGFFFWGASGVVMA